MKKEKGSEKRLKAIARELANFKEKTKGLRVKWGAEKELINEIKEIREKIDDLSYQTEIAQREADLEKVAEIKYGKIPQLIKEQKAIEQKLIKLQKDTHFLKEEVTEEDIARVVSRWTGIPVTRLITEEAKKIGNNGSYFKQESDRSIRSYQRYFKGDTKGTSRNFRRE